MDVAPPTATLIWGAPRTSRVFSLNAPVPSAVGRLASSLAAQLHDSDVRTRHTLVVKRLGGGDRATVADDARATVADDVRAALAGAPACEARVGGLDVFENPAGRAPVVYLAVESPGLVQIHEQLCDVFEPVSGLEGDDYDPHVTIARGGDARRLLDREIDPIRWTVDRLELWDATARESVESIALPA